MRATSLTNALNSEAFRADELTRGRVSLLMIRRPIAISILLHVGIALLMAWYATRAARNAPPRRQTLFVEITDTHKRKRDDSKDRRVVETLLTQKSQEAAPDAHWGKQTQTVARETITQQLRPRTGETRQQAQSKAQPKQAAIPKPAGPMSQLGVAMFRASAPQPPDAPAERNWAEMGMTPQDFVPGVKASDRTVLNTKEFVFFGYFQRIRERLDLAWQPILREHLTKLYKQGRQLASAADYTTRILVTLDSRGQVTRVQVLEESGTHDLDTAAVKAFNKAGPFPNPPNGILDTQGKVEIRWDFILKT